MSKAIIEEKAVKEFTVQEVRHLTDTAYVLRFDRNGMAFKAGQHLLIGAKGDPEPREYSIYSGENEDYIEVLIKEVEDGHTSKLLKNLTPGAALNVHGPNGFFMTNAKPPTGKKFLFIASGTGISPFHSFIKTYPRSNYKVIHGVRTKNEAYDKDHYNEGSFVACTSRDESGDYYGRITDYLLEQNFEPDLLVYLCGNSNMILDAIDILTAKGLKYEQIFTEVYF